jgi:hypothetical protein
MDRLQKRPGAPHVTVALHSSQRGTEVRIRLRYAGRLSCRTVARLLAVVVLALAATAAAVPAHEELARGVLYSIAGFAIGARPRHRS